MPPGLLNKTRRRVDVTVYGRLIDAVDGPVARHRLADDGNYVAWAAIRRAIGAWEDVADTLNVSVSAHAR